MPVWIHQRRHAGPLRAAGFNLAGLGIEAGAERVRASVDKSFDQDQVFEIVDKIHAAGISVIGNYIFGLPRMTTTPWDHARLGRRAQLRIRQLLLGDGLPGSPLHHEAVRQERHCRATDATRSIPPIACRCRRAT